MIRSCRAVSVSLILVSVCAAGLQGSSPESVSPTHSPAANTPPFEILTGRRSISVQVPTNSELPVTTTVTLRREDGFDKPVHVSASGAGPGITLRFDNGSSKVDLTRALPQSILTITVGTSVVAGEYSIQIVGTDGDLVESKEITLSVGTGGQFDLVLGVGSLIIKSDVTDYKVNNQVNVLQTTNLGRATPQLLTGAAFRLPFGNFSEGTKKRIGRRPWFAFLSLKFSPESSQTFSGYVIGGSYKVVPAFSILAGYSLTPIQEPSPGFRTAAVQIVQQNSSLPVYQRFNVNAMLRNESNAFDGFPLLVQNAAGPTATRVFEGNPTVVHYHGGFVIGVAIPISLKTVLGGGENK